MLRILMVKNDNPTKSYEKNKLIWEFIHKFIEDYSENLLILKDEYDTDDGFFTYLSELLIDKLSNEPRLLKNLHRNTIKAIPKVFIQVRDRNINMEEVIKIKIQFYYWFHLILKIVRKRLSKTLKFFQFTIFVIFLVFLMKEGENSFILHG